MNFITDLSIIKKKNAILIIIDRLIKMRHFIATITKVSIQIVANLYINNIYQFYRFLNIIIFNCDFQFVALF